jgi:hypothetical protein
MYEEEEMHRSKRVSLACRRGPGAVPRASAGAGRVAAPVGGSRVRSTCRRTLARRREQGSVDLPPDPRASAGAGLDLPPERVGFGLLPQRAIHRLQADGAPLRRWCAA